jgi:hypothetical protein
MSSGELETKPIELNNGHGWNYFRRVAKYGGRRSRSSVSKVIPWCFAVAENTPKLPRSRMACYYRAHAYIPLGGGGTECFGCVGGKRESIRPRHRLWKSYFLGWSTSKAEEGQTTSATLGSLQHRWAQAWRRAEKERNTAPKSCTEKKYNLRCNRYYQNLETHKRPKSTDLRDMQCTQRI